MSTLYRIVFRISPRLAAAWSRWSYVRETARIARLAERDTTSPRVAVPSRRGGAR